MEKLPAVLMFITHHISFVLGNNRKWILLETLLFFFLYPTRRSFDTSNTAVDLTRETTIILNQLNDSIEMFHIKNKT